MTHYIAYSTPGLDRAVFVNNMRAETEADRIVHVANAALDWRVAYSGHAKLDHLLGWPLGTARLADMLFEALPAAEARSFPLRLAEAIPQSADVTTLLDRWMVRTLREVVV